MGLAEDMTVACPGCGAPGTVTLHASVNPTRDPALKEKLLAGQLSVFACAKCGRNARIAHALLYADNARGLFVQLDPTGDFDVSAASTMFSGNVPRVSRLVRDGNTLIEKIKIDDAGLDDRVIEIWKLLLSSLHAEHANDPWYFERVESDGALRFTIVKSAGPLTTLRPRDEYDRVAADLERSGGLPPAPVFAVVDRAFAREHLAPTAKSPASS